MRVGRLSLMALIICALSRETRAQRATVEFAVTDSTGRPLPGATLDFTDISGTRRTATSGDGGRTLGVRLAPGRVSVLARRIGFVLGKLEVVVDTGLNVVPITLSATAAPMLDTMQIIGARPLDGLHRNDEFDQRRARKLATVSYDEHDIERRNPVDIWQMFRGVPSVTLVDTGKVGGVVATSSRSMNITPDYRLKPCYLRVMVDGRVQNPMGDPMDLRLLPSPKDIHGVELFAGPASIPVQYSGAGSDKWCGLIAVWTK